MTAGCACQRLNQIESELIRTRARIQQLHDDLQRMRGEIAPVVSAEMAEREKREIVPLAEIEKDAILRAVKSKGTLQAAKLLGVGKTTLYRKLREYGWAAGMGIGPRERDEVRQ